MTRRKTAATPEVGPVDVMRLLVGNLTAEPPVELERERYHDFTVRDRFYKVPVGEIFGVEDGWYVGDVWAVQVHGGVPHVAQSAEEAIPREGRRKPKTFDVRVDAGVSAQS